MDYKRLTIDLIKSSFAQYVVTGTIHEAALTDGISQLYKAIDKDTITNKDIPNPKELKKMYIRYEFL